MLLLKTIITRLARPQAKRSRAHHVAPLSRRSGPVRGVVAATVALAFLYMSVAPQDAHANPKPLPYSYFANVQPAGAFEIEGITDISPVRVSRETDDGTEAVTGLRLDLQTELEVGLSEAVEFGWYFVFAQSATAGGAAMAFQGLKQRIRWQLAPADEWPIDVALYFEVAELHNELELEAKVILSKRVGSWRFAVNLWAEEEYLFQDDRWVTVYNPTAGFVYELTPRFGLGLEYWLHGKTGDSTSDRAAAATDTGPMHYLGPTLYAATEGPWFSLGAYVRLDGIGDTPVVGDPFGKLWVRAIVGFDI